MKTVSKKETFFVYKFLNVNQETLYVGKTKSLTGRIQSTHFTKNGHLPDECYNETVIVVYSKCLSESDMTIQERYLINALNPKYNDLLNRGDTFSFTIDCFKWKYLPFIRLDERPKKENIESGLLTSYLPSVSLQTKPLAVPSLAETGMFSATRHHPDDLYNLYSLGKALKPLRGLWMNGKLWLSALSICKFSQAWSASDDSSKIRVIQFIKQGFLTCEDVCIIEDKEFRRSEYQASDFINKSSNGILIRAQALQGFVNGLFERHTRDEKKRFDRGATVKASYWSPYGDSPTKLCKTFEEYWEFMSGPNRTNVNLFTIAYRIPGVCKALSRIEPA